MIFHKTIEKVYKTTMFSRCDDTGLLHYFSHEDFRGMDATPYSFLSSLGHTLNGYFYSYIGYDPQRLVVFDHGFGGGHRSYMKEIQKLAKEGYLVFAYDHTGCMTSGGEGAGGLCQSLRDLDDCLKALKQDPAIAAKELYVVGHSWGGFSTLNIAKYHPDVKKIVVLAGFVSIEKNAGTKLFRYASGLPTLYLCARAKDKRRLHSRQCCGNAPKQPSASSSHL